jgi:hypothetical protein
VTGKNGRMLFDRPKPTVGCSASGRRRIRMERYGVTKPAGKTTNPRLYCHECMENIPYKAAYTIWSSVDERKMFETSRR